MNEVSISVPKHYDKPVQPWDLERHMESSGNAFVDARRTDVIEYCFRMKGDLLDDLRKAKHCLEVAIKELEQDGSNPDWKMTDQKYGPQWSEIVEESERVFQKMLSRDGMETLFDIWLQAQKEKSSISVLPPE